MRGYKSDRISSRRATAYHRMRRSTVSRVRIVRLAGSGERGDSPKDECPLLYVSGHARTACPEKITKYVWCEWTT